RRQLLGSFRLLLEAFSNGQIRLGALTRQGLGRGRIDQWTLARLNMSDRGHVLWWLRQGWRELSAETQLPTGSAILLGDLDSLPARAEGLSIPGTFGLRTSLVIRAGGESLDDPDSVHLTESGKHLLSGTSFRGALRARCGRIARTLNLPNAD